MYAGHFAGQVIKKTCLLVYLAEELETPLTSDKLLSLHQFVHLLEINGRMPSPLFEYSYNF